MLAIFLVVLLAPRCPLRLGRSHPDCRAAPARPATAAPGHRAGGEIGGEIGPLVVPRDGHADGEGGAGWGARSHAGQAAGAGRPGGGSAASPSAARSRRTAWGSGPRPRIRPP